MMGNMENHLLYHACWPETYELFCASEEIMIKGIRHTTKSNNRYSNGGRVKIELTERLRPANAPGWANFQEAIGADICSRFAKSFSFPIFTDKILVFDSDISLFIFDQALYEDLKDLDEEALSFDTGEKLEYWISLYWNSMMTIEQYFLKRPYPKPEVLIFEPVPKEIIRVSGDFNSQPWLAER